MNPEIVIRPQRPDHPQVVAALAALDAYLASLYEPEANHILSIAELMVPDVSFLAAWQRERVVGTGAARQLSDHSGEIKRMYVDPALRGQRLGSRLVAALEGSMRDQGLLLAQLETGAAQVDAVRLYERSGYTRCQAFGGYPDNGLSIFFEKHL